MRRQVVKAVVFLIFFMPFFMRVGCLSAAPGEKFESQTQKKKRIKTIVEDVVRSGGSMQDAVRSVCKNYWYKSRELSVAQQRKINKAVMELKKMLPPSMVLTATFTSEEQVRGIIRKIEKLRVEMPEKDRSLRKQRLYAEAKKRYPYVPVKLYSKVYVSYMRNGVVVECSGRFLPSADPDVIHVGPYRIPISDIQESQRARFSPEETEKLRQRYVKRALASGHEEDEVRFQQLLDKHEDELHLHDNDVLYVNRWYTLQEYTAMIYEKIKRRQEEGFSD